MDFRKETVAELADAVRSGKVSARELTQVALDRIDALNPRLNAFVAVDGEAALDAAAEVDEAIAGGDDPGPLAGIPIGVKDNMDAAGYRTTIGSALHADRAPATTDCVLVARLKAAGCVVVGKTNTPEFAWTADTYNDLFGRTGNPWELARSPGGSSGGTSAALAAGMVPLATGSDGGGSIRIPAAACGLAGFKPSLGRIPTADPTPPNWGPLSTRGPMARTTADTVLALDAVIGPDPRDIYSLPMPEPSWTGVLETAHVPMRVAWSPDLGYANVDAEVRAVCEQAVAKLDELGAEIVRIDKVFDADPSLAWFTIAAAGTARTLEPLRDTPGWDRVDPGITRQLDFAAGVSAADLARAYDQCHHLNWRLVELFRDVRLLVCPATAAVPPIHGEPAIINGDEHALWVPLCLPFNMTRSPAGTVCAGFTDAGLPVGLQLIGPQHGDLVVLRTMAALEAGLGIDRLAPVGS
jgi:aspartyl-tRNA(Asn)/glutamyl-tRNA(Gln) amidotransferase subunit A